jgi:sugar/nucleoside kinase (ribokinase family)
MGSRVKILIPKLQTYNTFFMNILGMGNALVDIMTELNDDSVLLRFKLPKGSMTLVDKEMSDYIHIETSGCQKRKASGGSAANTIHGLSHLGVKTSFIGKIGTDEMGRFFKKDMQMNGINPILYNSHTDTGRSVAMISPDSERTFATYLGAAIELSVDDITLDIFKGYNFFYIEGYLVQNTQLIEKALRLSKHAGLRTCLDLASYNIVEANKVFLNSIINNYVDIVFANEDEARALTGKEPAEAVISLSNMCEIAVVKTGPKGSLIKSDKNLVKIEAIAAHVKDTTGAGDLYAAGFLYGLGKGFGIEKSGEIGTLLASKVIEHIGAKMDDSTWEIVRSEIRQMQKEERD